MEEYVITVDREVVKITRSKNLHFVKNKVRKIHTDTGTALKRRLFF